MSKHESLAAALAAFQAEIPTIGKTNTAKVPTKTGPGYSYTYADLATVTAVVLPLLAAHGLAWTAAPTVAESGGLVLDYRLMHESGESVGGQYPLQGGSPQQVGSAITYARRYCLTAVTGVAPTDDDDDAAAAQHAYNARPAPTARPEPVRAPSGASAAVAAHRAESDAPSMSDADILAIKSLGELRGLWPHFSEAQRAVAAKHANTLADLEATEAGESA